MQSVPVNRLYSVGWIDPAADAQRKRYGTSRQAIVVVGQDSVERVFIRHAWAGRIAPDRLIERLFETNERFAPLAMFGIDASGPQLLFAQLIRKEAISKGVKINLQPRALHADKAFSIETTLQPVAAGGRLFRPSEDDCRYLMEEWKAFPDGMFRDLLDALACAIRLLPAVLPEHLKNMNREQLRSYLRRTGLSEPDIANRLQQHDEFAAARSSGNHGA